MFFCCCGCVARRGEQVYRCGCAEGFFLLRSVNRRNWRREWCLVTVYSPPWMLLQRQVQLSLFLLVVVRRLPRLNNSWASPHLPCAPSPWSSAVAIVSGKSDPSTDPHVSPMSSPLGKSVTFHIFWQTRRRKARRPYESKTPKKHTKSLRCYGTTTKQASKKAQPHWTVFSHSCPNLSGLENFTTQKTTKQQTFLSFPILYIFKNNPTFWQTSWVLYNNNNNNDNNNNNMDEREKIFNEIVETERKYLANLELLSKVRMGGISTFF